MEQIATTAVDTRAVRGGAWEASAGRDLGAFTAPMTCHQPAKPRVSNGSAVRPTGPPGAPAG